MSDAQPPQGASQVYALSLWKCLSAPYLSNAFSREDAVVCFLHHYRYLRDAMPFARIEELAERDHVLFEVVDYTVTLKMEHVIPNEGELTLHFKQGEHALYGLSFSFVPGGAFGVTAPCVAVIGRMQGRTGEAARIARASKACGDITPQSVLYCALLGIVSAAGIDRLFGVSAADQVCHSEPIASLLERAYDRFYLTVGGVGHSNGFFQMPPGGQSKPLSLIARSHRRRTRIKREEKGRIVEAARISWVRLVEG